MRSSQQAAARARLAGVAAAAALTAGGAVIIAACGGTPGGGAGGQATTSSTHRAAAVSCGVTRTAANVPVRIKVKHGQVPCGTAMAVEREYARAIMEGKAPGNGGGGPVHVQGWTCQGFDTPTVLATANASKCVLGGDEILAVLLAPT